MRVRRIVASVASAVMILGGVSVSAAPAASAFPVSAQATTGDAAPRAKVPVTVTVRNGGRVLVVRVDWHDGLDARPGRDRFTVRVMAGTRELERRVRWDSREDVETIAVRLTAREAKAFGAARSSGDAVVAVTQQSDTDDDTLFERNHATVVRVSATDRVSYRDSLPLRDCADVVIEANADLNHCDLHGADLWRTDLAGANLTGANLTGADLTTASLFLADLTGANLTGAIFVLYATLDSADLTGANLTGANLNTATLRGANLTGVDATNANLASDLTNANLTNANLTNMSLVAPIMTGADLTGAFVDCGTGGILGDNINSQPAAWPAGWTVNDDGVLTVPVVPCP